MPYLYYNDKIVGYMGRNIKRKQGKNRFIQKAPADYMFNQHLLNLQSGKYAFIVESPLDAIAINGLATRESRLTQKQINLLKIGGKEPVLIPDLKKGEWEPYLTTAEENVWFISVPDSKRNFGKDVGDSVKQNGLLYTLESLTQGMTKNYTKARMQLSMVGK